MVADMFVVTLEPEYRADSKLVTIEDELSLGLQLTEKSANWLRRFYADRDDDWLERKYMPIKFFSEWEKYEWLFKRAIAGYRLSAADHMYIQWYESRPEYHALERLYGRYFQLKRIFADQLRPVFGTYDRSNPQ